MKQYWPIAAFFLPLILAWVTRPYRANASNRYEQPPYPEGIS